MSLSLRPARKRPFSVSSLALSLLVATTGGRAASTRAVAALMDCSSPAVLRRTGVSIDKRSQFWKDKTVWIIGASSGIGEALVYEWAHLLQQEKVASPSTKGRIILSGRSLDKLRAVQERCYQILEIDDARDSEGNNLGHRDTKFDGIIDIFPLDVTQIDDMTERLDGYFQRKTGSLLPDIVFMNAGQGQLCPAVDTSIQESEELFRVNILWHMSLVPWLLHRKKKEDKKALHLVVSSSIAGLYGVPLSSVYASTKFAMEGYYQSLRAELTRGELAGVRLDLIRPGPVDTNFHGKLEGKNEDVTRKNHENELVTSSKRTTTASTSPLKMSSARCAQLIMANCELKKGGSDIILGKHAWFLAIARYIPFYNWILCHWIGPKRMQLFREGKDLYDPLNWK